MEVVLGLGSLVWVVLRSTVACQEWRPKKRSAKTRGGSVAGLGRGTAGQLHRSEQLRGVIHGISRLADCSEGNASRIMKGNSQMRVV